MTAKPVPFDEQMKLIMECRSSGLSDHQWCQEHDIKPGTFYAWIRRHKQKSCCEIPVPAGKQQIPQKQDIVRIDPGAVQTEDTVPATDLSAGNSRDVLPISMELLIGGVAIRITNDVSPELFAQTLRILKGMSC